MMRLLFDNPVLIKHVRSRLRRQHIVPLTIVIVMLSLCLLWAGFALKGFENGVVFSIFFALQGCILLLVGTSQVASSIAQASETGILDFHRVSPLPSQTQAIGFLLGTPIREYCMAGTILPFAVFCSFMAPPNPAGYALLLIVLILSAWIFHALAMIAGLIADKKKRSTGNSVIVLVVLAHLAAAPWFLTWIALPALLTVVPTYCELMGHFAPQRAPARGNGPVFFGFALPLLVQSLICQIPLFIFLMIAVIRRLRSQRVHVYSKGTATAFLTVIIFLTLGGIVGHPRVQTEWFIPTVLYTVVLAAIFLILAMTPSAGEFANGLRRARKMHRFRPTMWDDLASNRNTVLVFCGLVFCSVVVAASLMPAQLPDSRIWLMAGTAVCVLAYFGFSTQLFELRFGKKAKPYLGLLYFVIWVMPLLLSALLRINVRGDLPDHILNLSPLFGLASGSSISTGTSFVLALVFGWGLLATEEQATREATSV